MPLQIVLEQAPQDLRTLLQDKETLLDWRLKRHIALDIAKGMTYIHSKLICHNQLRSGKIFVREEFSILAHKHSKVVSMDPNSDIVAKIGGSQLLKFNDIHHKPSIGLYPW